MDFIDGIFKEIYELQEIINFILSENRIDWIYILEKGENTESIYEDIFENKENLLKDIYFGEYKTEGKSTGKSEPQTKVQREYTEKYKEKIKNTENTIYETIQKIKNEFERIFENGFYESDNFYIFKDYRENEKVERDIKSIFSIIYDDKKEEAKKERIYTVLQKGFKGKEILQQDSKNNFFSEEDFRNIFEKNENKNSYKFDNILNYVRNEQNIYRERSNQRYEKEKNKNKEVNITLNNYNSEYSTTDEERIINSIAEKIIEYAQCGAEGIHI